MERKTVSLSHLNPTQQKAMATHPSTLAWKIPWTEEPAGLQSTGSLESGTTERLHLHFSLCTQILPWTLILGESKKTHLMT